MQLRVEDVIPDPNGPIIPFVPAFTGNLNLLTSTKGFSASETITMLRAVAVESSESQQSVSEALCLWNE